LHGSFARPRLHRSGWRKAGRWMSRRCSSTLRPGGERYCTDSGGIDRVRSDIGAKGERMNSDVLVPRIKGGAMMVQEGLLLPKAVGLQSSRYFEGWRAVMALDSFGLDASLRAAGWALHCIAGEIRVHVLGRDGDANIRRAMRRVFHQTQEMAFNCVGLRQITRTSFLGIPYVVISAQAYHIQQSVFLESLAIRTQKQHDADSASR